MCLDITQHHVWHLDDMMVGSIIFVWFFCSFLSMAVNTIGKLQFLSFIVIWAMRSAPAFSMFIDVVRAMYTRIFHF